TLWRRTAAARHQSQGDEESERARDAASSCSAAAHPGATYAGVLRDHWALTSEDALSERPSREIPAEGECSANAPCSAEVEVGAGEDLVYLEDIGTAEHFLRRPTRVGRGEIGAVGPGDEIVEGPPPGLHLVVDLRVRVLRPAAPLVIELHRAWSVDLVADE